jgi:uncharacterized protein YcfL
LSAVAVAIPGAMPTAAPRKGARPSAQAPSSKPGASQPAAGAPPLASTRHARVRVDYRICWFDVNGMEIDGDTKPYRSLILEGRDAVTVTGVANSAAGVSSKLRIREASQSE